MKPVLTDCFFNGALAEGSNPNWFQQARHLSYRTLKKFFKIFAFFLNGFKPTVFGGAAGGGAAPNANSDEAKSRRSGASEELTQCVNNF
ncbi:MAG: hypothetical protein UW22_C0021G0008 [Candidatus Gottesmanbacteria bacterium GW2011_GWB1_44_11c]|uniref:Uncharacterized protein n=2 Tax=Candidatus Gottesmaniibacteriota TaxID=1752720 RepID=A0A0G1IMW1_9BACT|nr:MAG: hypothetical protein UW22_C0021G0008 [Candidatus Gottesmanbacteria bacterium GW2011_GWB1_44_11c]KKT60490.1 MAG: hypothetical protein UW52_C0026G0008 [Candidatus Gottesmanbacteria bacterium GW2011_GWA1_44_24b]HCM82049.1 hypothetical protein [Patescibacteria group bacterium]